jgi:hypothetical protein
MEPNNNQPISANPIGQPASPLQSVLPQAPVGQPTSTVPVNPIPQANPVSQPAVGQNPPTAPKKGKKLLALLLILFLLVLGMGGYLYFASNRAKVAQKNSVNTNTVAPTSVVVPTVTPESVDDVSVDNPNTDLNGIETDVQGL